MTDDDTRTLTELAATLAEASESAREAQLDEQRARSEATTALNRLNEAQKAFDAHVDAVKKQALRGSNWGDYGRREGARA